MVFSSYIFDPYFCVGVASKECSSNMFYFVNRKNSIFSRTIG